MKHVLILFCILASVTSEARIIRLQKNNDNALYKPDHGAKPGDTILLEGNYQYINLENVNGEAGREIVITNKGLVTVSGYKTYCCIVSGKYFKILGDGEPSIKNGIKFSGFGNVYAGFGLALTNSSNVEVAHCEFVHLQAGIFQNPISKTDMVDCYYHDLFMHDFENPEEKGRSEGFYLGNTGAISPGKFRNCRIEDNILQDLSGDGIQVCQGNFIIKGNRIIHWAKAQLQWQRNGILVGGDASAEVENNVLEGGGGVAFQFLGGGKKNTFKNNLIKDVDVSSLPTEDIIYIDARSKGFSMEFSTNRFSNVKPNRKVIFNVTADKNNSGTQFKYNKGVDESQCLLSGKDKWVL